MIPLVPASEGAAGAAGFPQESKHGKMVLFYSLGLRGL
jgi:hypothetical protein